MTFGFILTRCVNSELTNKYWNECIKCIRRFYPIERIIVIDDNSKQEFIKADFEYNNVEIVQSEFPQRGELLPYYYFHKFHYFDNAVILHDSVFIHRKIAFKSLENSNISVIPLWHFEKYKGHNPNNTKRIASYLKNNKYVLNKINMEQTTSLNFNLVSSQNNWNGCFGCQSFINYNFLHFLQNKYNLFKLIDAVRNRDDRCCLERIMGLLFHLEYPQITKRGSILGSIIKHNKWWYTFNNYIDDKQARKLTNPVIKVFSGR